MIHEASIASRINTSTYGFQRTLRYGFCRDRSRRSPTLPQATPMPITRYMIWSGSQRHMSSSGLRTTMPLLRSFKPRHVNRFFVSSSPDGVIRRTNSSDETFDSIAGGSHSTRDLDKNLSSSSSFKVSRVSYDGTM
jgi:hypothetical protein